jgi:hypothetical protein
MGRGQSCSHRKPSAPAKDLRCVGECVGQTERAGVGIRN